MNCEHCGGDITRQVALHQVHEAATQLVEHLGRASKARIVDPLITRLSDAVARRFRSQVKAYRKSKTLELPPTVNATFRAIFNRQTAAAYDGGAAHVEAALEKQIREAKRVLPGYISKRGAEDLEIELDDTSRDQLATIEGSGHTAAVVATAIRLKFIDWARDRAAATGTHEISRAFHAGGADVAKLISDEHGGHFVERHWDVQDNPCELCEENSAAGWIGEDEQYPNFPEGPPGHFRCVCSESYRTVGQSEEARR